MLYKHRVRRQKTPEPGLRATLRYLHVDIEGLGTVLTSSLDCEPLQSIQKPIREGTKILYKPAS